MFTLLGVTATFAAAGVSQWMPVLRQIGGAILVILGLNLAGDPAHPSPRSNLAAAGRRGIGLARRRDRHDVVRVTGWRPRLGDRLGGRLVSRRGGWLASFGLGAIFAIGWTPCIGVILGGILTMASTSGTVAQGGILLVAYTIGLGLPFLAIALLYDRAPALLRPLVRHGRAVSVVGGLLVVGIGLAMIFDWLARLPVLFNFPGV